MAMIRADKVLQRYRKGYIMEFENNDLINNVFALIMKCPFESSNIKVNCPLAEKRLLKKTKLKYTFVMKLSNKELIEILRKHCACPRYEYYMGKRYHKDILISMNQ